MKIRKIIRKNNAVSGVIEALLIVGLVAIILATIQLVYVPPVMEDREEAHMKEVEKQFSYLKSTVDIQSMTKEKVLISSPVTLGSRELPYFVTIGATGQINLLDENDVGEAEIKVGPAPSFIPVHTEFDNGIPLTSIIYEARNVYITDYTFIFEGGGIIVKRPAEGMTVKPPIVVEDGASDITIYYSLPFFTSSPGKKIEASGYGDPDLVAFIRTNYSTHYTASEDNINYLEIYTYYPDAWYQSLFYNDTGLLWQYYENGDIAVARDDSQSPSVITITPDNKNIDLVITVVKIGVQIGPGIVR